jgi:hypothetical protein
MGGKADKPPFFSLLLFTITACLIVLFGYLWLFSSTAELVSALRVEEPVVQFEMGAMYMFGIGIGILAMIPSAVVRLLGQPLSERMDKFVARGMIFGFVMMFSLPQIVHFAVHKITSKRPYVVCEEMSDQWLLDKTYVYTDNQETCKVLVEERERWRRSL